jgi:hypothetical protein
MCERTVSVRIASSAAPGPGARAAVPAGPSITVYDAFGNVIYDFGVNIPDGQGDIVVRFL